MALAAKDIIFFTEDEENEYICLASLGIQSLASLHQLCTEADPFFIYGLMMPAPEDAAMLNMERLCSEISDVCERHFLARSLESPAHDRLWELCLAFLQQHRRIPTDDDVETMFPGCTADYRARHLAPDALSRPTNPRAREAALVMAAASASPRAANQPQDEVSELEESEPEEEEEQPAPAAPAEPVVVVQPQAADAASPSKKRKAKTKTTKSSRSEYVRSLIEANKTLRRNTLKLIHLHSYY